MLKEFWNLPELKTSVKSVSVKLLIVSKKLMFRNGFVIVNMITITLIFVTGSEKTWLPHRQ